MKASAIAVLALSASACSLDSWNPPLQPTIANGYHRCSSGALCPEFTECRPDMRCAYSGDPNGPGASDAALDSSFRVTPFR